METRLGQVAPCFVAAEAIPAACLPVVEMEVVAEGPCKGPWLLVLPRGSLSFQASPGGLLVPVGCPVLFVWPWWAFSCHVLSCLSSPGGLLIPPDYPREFFGGGKRVLAVGAGPRGLRPRCRRQSAMASWAPSSVMVSRAPSSAMASWAPSSAMASWAPCTAMASRAPSSAMASWAPCTAMASWAPCTTMASWAPSSAMVPVCLFCSGGPRPAFLSVSVLRVLQSAHPPSLMELLRLGTSLSGGGVMSVLCRVCHVFLPLVSLFGLFPVLVWCDY